MSMRSLIAQEIRAGSDTMVGTVLSRRRMTLFDLSVEGSPTWVVDVDIGNKSRFLSDVPVKGGSDGSRFYAGVGQTVLLKSNAKGRWDVIGPASQSIANTNLCKYDMATRTLVSMAMHGFLVERVPHAFYVGEVRLKYTAGGQGISFTTSTINRTFGSWISDGFAAADDIVFTGTQNGNDINQGSNPAFYTVQSVTSADLIFAGTPFAAEGPLTIAVGIDGNVRFGNGNTDQPYNLIRKTDAQGVPV